MLRVGYIMLIKSFEWWHNLLLSPVKAVKYTFRCTSTSLYKDWSPNTARAQKPNADDPSYVSTLQWKTGRMLWQEDALWSLFAFLFGLPQHKYTHLSRQPCTHSHTQAHTHVHASRRINIHSLSHLLKHSHTHKHTHTHYSYINTSNTEIHCTHNNNNSD